MFSIETFDSGNLETLLFYTICLGILLFIGVFIRTKIKIFKKYVIPASLIAGVLGLLLGPDVLGLFPTEMIDTWAGYSGILISIIFAPMLIGVEVNMKRFKETQAIPQLIYGWCSSLLQWGIPLVLMALLFTPLFGTNPLFGSLIEMGWAGGHGTAAGMAEVFKDLGWEEGRSVGLTMATIGLLVGIIGGTIIINYGVRKGYTNYINRDDISTEGTRPDIIPSSDQTSSSVSTLRADVVDGYGFHFAVISIAILIGMVLKGWIEPFVPGMPLFPLAMIGGFIVSQILKRTSYYKALDPGTFQRIQGFSLDLLIVSAISAVSIPVIVDYFLPLLIISIIILFLVVFFFFYFGPRLFKNDWFEHSILQFGTFAGVAAVGYMLLRMVDPKFQSDAFLAYGLRAPFLSPFIGGGLITSIVPILTHSYGAWIIGVISIASMILIMILAKVFGLYGRHRNSYFVRDDVSNKRDDSL